MIRKGYYAIISKEGAYKLIDEAKKKQEDYERRETKRINEERMQQQIYKEQDDYER